ncbi:MAG: PH domain-containing protein [Victivallales bacterium]|nr:PH domain-containing protein [Victivallales bacterium]
MYEWLKKQMLRLLKVPSEPDDPMGDVQSLRVFRASYNFFRYRFYCWLIKNTIGLFFAAVAGLIFGLSYYRHLTQKFGSDSAWLAVLLLAAVFLLYSWCQTFISYMAMRLDYELRWYKVSDRSMRIREGVVMVREMTMTFANIQNISIVQGPIQRLFGIADLKVESAGGGGGMPTATAKGMPETLGFHVAYFRGIDNAEEIRDLMRVRLEKIRSAGLGGDGYGEPTEPAVTAALPLEELRRVCEEASRLHAVAARFAAGAPHAG